jgi:hypothetical protein
MKALKIKNPLSIFAIFATLVEIACGTLAALTSNDNQVLLIWFIVLFPVLLLIAFFITLNFNHHVLYSPEDFKGADANVLNRFYGGFTAPNKLESTSEIIKPNIGNEEKQRTIFSNLNEYGNNFNDEEKSLLDYMNNLATYVTKLLPEGKLEEIWINLININYFFIEIRIKEEFLKENVNLRNIFVIYIKKNETEENYPKGEIFGIVAGSGTESGKGSIITIGNYIVGIIMSKITITENGVIGK